VYVKFILRNKTITNLIVIYKVICYPKTGYKQLIILFIKKSPELSFQFHLNLKGLRHFPQFIASYYDYYFLIFNYKKRIKYAP
jgi:hypothetical protein